MKEIAAELYHRTPEYSSMTISTIDRFWEVFFCNNLLFDSRCDSNK